MTFLEKKDTKLIYIYIYILRTNIYIIYIIHIDIFLKPYGPFLWMGFNLKGGNFKYRLVFLKLHTNKKVLQ